MCKYTHLLVEEKNNNNFLFACGCYCYNQIKAWQAALRRELKIYKKDCEIQIPSLKEFPFATHYRKKRQ